MSNFLTITNEGKPLITTGDFARGFFRHSLCVNFEALQDGKRFDAFSVSEDHDTEGMAMDEYHGLEKSWYLPSGCRTAALRELVEGIIARADELTTGYSEEWDGSNMVGRWADEDVYEFWADEMDQKIADMDTIEVYDLSDMDNLPYVLDCVKDAAGDDWDFIVNKPAGELPQAIEDLLADCYASDSDTTYIGYTDACDSIVAGILQRRDTPWHELIVTDAEGATVGALGDVVETAPANLDTVGWQGDMIAVWPDFFLSLHGEDVVDANGEPTLDPSDINWTGIRERLAAVAGN